MKATGIILLLLVWHTSFSQWNDNFLDGDFVFNPSWNGDTANFIIENTALRLFAPAIDSTSYLSTPSSLINNGSWQFSVHLDFNPSSNNYAKIYLVSSADVLTGSLNGYFIKIGNTADEISLYRQDGTVAIEIIDGLDGRVGLSIVDVTILATRDFNGEWQLSSKLATETNWYLEGSTIDKTYLASSWFGVNCTYTSTRSTKFYFDNFIVSGTPYVDTDPPLIDTVYSIANRQLFVKLNEAIDSTSASPPQHYTLNQQFTPATVIVTDSAINLTFTNPLPVINQLAISNIEDIHGNIIADTLVQVIYVDDAPVIYGDIVINEIMADPSPVEDLPEAEYIELYNTSAKAINMTRWSYLDKVSVAVIPGGIILPDSFLVLTHNADVEALNVYGSTIGLSPWPSLNNPGDSLSLLDSAGNLIDIVIYDKTWYRDNTKDDGGWSLERINPGHPCSGYLNWAASIDLKGGSPGVVNSVVSKTDNEAPVVLNYLVEQSKLTITFDEPIMENMGDILVFPENPVLATIVDYNHLSIEFEQTFVSETSNQVFISYVADCFGNKSDSVVIEFVPDFSAPAIDTVFSNYPHIIEVYFSEPVQTPEIIDLIIIPDLSPGELIHDTSNPSHVVLYFADNLAEGVFYTLKADSVFDIFGNVEPVLSYTFKYQPLQYPQFGEVLITEIMADPSPAISLPEYEYLELTNKSTKRLLLKELILADSKDEVKIPTGIIEPGERVILTKTTAKDDFLGYAKTIGVPNWPTLNNTGDEITILDPQHRIINSVAYTDEWYKYADKAEGGWSLELVDETNYCQGNIVWTASQGVLGGTPGEINAVVSTINDLRPPGISEAFAFTEDSILVRFNKPLIDQLPVFSLQETAIINSGFTNYLLNECFLYVEPLQPRTIYTLTAEGIISCAGNLNTRDETTVILTEKAEPGDVVISEVLFNPVSDGTDFIEVFNNSPKYIIMDNWLFANGGAVKTIGLRNMLEPYSFRVFTSNPINILDQYPKALPNKIFEQELPAMANEEGNIALYSAETIRIDSIHYEESWHFPFLEDVNGVSLERINMIADGTVSSNWASASSLDNYATPGYINTSAINRHSSQVVTLEPKVIVPDGNGLDDFTTIMINALNTSALVSINVFNLTGQPIRELANNTLVGSYTNFIWDGTDSFGSVVPLGHYIIVVEMISGDAKTSIYRNKVVVAKGF